MQNRYFSNKDDLTMSVFGLSEKKNDNTVDIMYLKWTILKERCWNSFKSETL